MKSRDTEKNNKLNKAQRGIALAGVILLGVLVVATLVLAIINKPELKNVFNLLFVLDIAVPVMLWMYMYLYQRARKTDAAMEEIAEKELKEEEILRNLRKAKEEDKDAQAEATEDLKEDINEE